MRRVIRIVVAALIVVSLLATGVSMTQRDVGAAAVVNLTPVMASGSGHGLLVSSDVAAVPPASHVNFRPGSVDPNVDVTPIGADGRLCFMASEHASGHLVADLLGVIDHDAAHLPRTDGTPLRRLDTRQP